MKLSLISICLLFLSYGCSKGSPTPTEPTEPTLDTTAKESSGHGTIKRWDGENWIDTADRLVVSRTWRFLSHLETDDGGVRIKGGYTMDMSNPSENDVNFNFSKLIFEDTIGIPIYEYILSSRIERDVEANGTDNYVGTFEIELDSINLANQITRMDIWGSARIPVE